MALLRNDTRDVYAPNIPNVILISGSKTVKA